MSHHVILTLPDGLPVRVDYRQPIVPVLRQIHAELEKPRERRDYAKLARLDLVAAAWRDDNPGLQCSAEEIRSGACDARHGPADPADGWPKGAD